MKPEERQALQQNELEQEYVGHLKPFLEKYGRLLALIAVGAVLLFVAYSLFVGSSRTEREAGWGPLFRGADLAGDVTSYEAVADTAEYGETNATVWAHLLAGDEYLRTAARLVYSDAASADESLESARGHFRSAADDSGAPDAARAKALYGLGQVEEAASEGDTAAAAALYQEVVDDYPDSPLAAAAEVRLAALKRPTTGPFLAWFAAQNPEPADIARPVDGAPAEDGDDAPLPGLEEEPAAPAEDAKSDGEDAEGGDEADSTGVEEASAADEAGMAEALEAEAAAESDSDADSEADAEDAPDGE